MPTRVFNADDHPMLLKGIIDLIRNTEGLEWVGSAGDGREALAKIRNLNPDIAILDIEMPYMNGLEVAKTLIAEGCETGIILLTLFKEESFLRNAISTGVKGYLLKESSEKEILDCIESVSKGQIYVNPKLTHILLDSKAKEHQIFDILSKQELNILKLIASHKTSAEIADMLFISPKTVGNHRSNITKKLELSGEQNSLLKWALDHKDLIG